ncbi:DUF4097 family beta strand repeat-containing protein [Pediococcus claussenii]|uniref:DUF4097 domain-containing protein n=1 Tax=Pediococcus claussenii (strain ATCC BAA-344 / DSM 14800 / JCM 18046 / KCTC 3811 / LMG 21948 / P06) TaxID=701521 RepID=G8PB86_PEDCP|nr:DUF4097 family beta strand repeat-containing protein [Pediococcus claussenii]AEV94715.1 hypothetical protein PECL_410 [Pediococcus claussenii ATCC BAA-344]ANZ69910.1 hypothetical protein AYR57_06120 [Pediococcus claussenii]ANZ71727.1 hypothetical protein AYR58_06125 [Pediococcus claussenii]KRN20894.1 hypothetical protein IV79_GL000119 [Pediococcus claussenii]
MTKIETEIRTRLDQLFIKAKPSTQLTELKEELIADLVEFTRDNVNEGMNEDEAIDAAFKQMGSVDELIHEINEEEDNKDESGDSQAETSSRFKLGELEVNDSQVKLGNHIIIDDDRVDMGKFLQVNGDHVNLFNGFIDVDSDHVHIAGIDAVDSFSGNLDLVNTVEFNLKNISDLDIAYRSASIIVTNGDSDKLVVKEYMSRFNDQYKLKSAQYDNRLEIREGIRPRLHWIKVRIEVQLPKDYDGSLNLESRDGKLVAKNLHNEKMKLNLNDYSGSMQLDSVASNALTVYVHSGSLTGDTIFANTIKMNAHSGSMRLNYISGKVAIMAQSGSVKIDHFAGTGAFDVNSGSLRLVADQLIGSNLINAKSGSVHVELAKGVNAKYQLIANSSTAKITGAAHIENQTNSYLEGTVGTDPTAELKIKAHSGRINVNVQ